MLFFRSEEQVRLWCAERGATPGPLVSMDQLWRLAHRWYGTRLQPNPWRPQAHEVAPTFAQFGLTGDFWDPQASGPAQERLDAD